MRQVHQLHVAWRPDVYAPAEPVLPREAFEVSVSAGEALVYERDGAAVGVALFMERRVSGGVKAARRTLFVDTVAVLEGFRGRGVGRALLDALCAVARERGLAGVELQVNACNERAMGAYKAYGFTEKSVNMEICF